MKNKKIVYTFLLTGAILLLSLGCKKEVEDIRGANNPNSRWSLKTIEMTATSKIV